MSDQFVEHHSALEDEIAHMQAQLEAVEIPPNIDPQLLALWIQREKDKIEAKKRKFTKPPKKYGRNLTRLFPAYIGIAVMCLTILLGLIQGKDPETILKMTCVVFFIYAIIGYFVGVIAEHCVNESVESLLRDIVKRSHESGMPSATE
jgi:hypothetical protein